jgi:hypothetical protein
MYIGAVWLYNRLTIASDRVGRIGFWALAAFLYLAYVANIVTPPPPSPNAVAWGALAMWIIIPLAWWVDKHRAVGSAQTTPQTN